MELSFPRALFTTILSLTVLYALLIVVKPLFLIHNETISRSKQFLSK